MNESQQQRDDSVSMLTLGTVFIRDRWRILRWTLIGGVLAFVYVLVQPPKYVASASFTPQQSSDAGRTGLLELAGQFGVALPTQNQALSPDYYAMLLRSRSLLVDIARDSFKIQPGPDPGQAFVDLFGIEEGSPKRREEAALKLLRRIVVSTVSKPTGVVNLSVQTKWPSVSLAVATQLVNGVDEFNRRTKQVQAAAERKFIEDRLQIASLELRRVEDRLQSFLSGNRGCCASPELAFQRDRLEREVSSHQQVFNSLTQAYEDARIREVRDTPLITVIDFPSVSDEPEPRQLPKRILLGLLLGAFVGVVLALMSGMISQRADPQRDVDAFVAALGEAKGDVLARTRWIRHLVRR
ncbi:MAG: Wzz/FepE/Etk N-terminal domain-containing protein [Gemmatimonadota bacterium]